MVQAQMLLFPVDEEPKNPVPRTKLVATPVAIATPVTPPIPPPKKPATEKSALDQLREQLNRLQSRPLVEDSEPEPTYSVGGDVIDTLLPHGGIRRGTVVQWVSGQVHGNPGNVGQRDVGLGYGGATLAMIAAGQIAASQWSGGKPLVIFDEGQKVSFYPPAAIALGVPADRMVVVTKQPQHTRADMIWAIDQALRCDAVAAVWAELGPWLSDRDARRLQLAAETGGTVGLFIRPADVRRRASFADLSFCVEKLPGDHADTFSVQIDRCRGGANGAKVMVQVQPTATSQRLIAARVPAFTAKRPATTARREAS